MAAPVSDNSVAAIWSVATTTDAYGFEQEETEVLLLRISVLSVPLMFLHFTRSTPMLFETTNA